MNTIELGAKYVNAIRTWITEMEAVTVIELRAQRISNMHVGFDERRITSFIPEKSDVALLLNLSYDGTWSRSEIPITSVARWIAHNIGSSLAQKDDQKFNAEADSWREIVEYRSPEGPDRSNRSNSSDAKSNYSRLMAAWLDRAEVGITTASRIYSPDPLNQQAQECDAGGTFITWFKDSEGILWMIDQRTSGVSNELVVHRCSVHGAEIGLGLLVASAGFAEWKSFEVDDGTVD